MRHGVPPCKGAMAVGITSPIPASSGGRGAAGRGRPGRSSFASHEDRSCWPRQRLQHRSNERETPKRLRRLLVSVSGNRFTQAPPRSTRRRPRPRRCGSSYRPGTAACSRSWGRPASGRPCVRARSARPSSPASPDRRERSARRTCAASGHGTTSRAPTGWVKERSGSRESVQGASLTLMSGSCRSRPHFSLPPQICP